MPDVKSLLPGRAFRSEHAQLRPEPHSIASHGPAPMDPLQTTRMRNGVLYAAEWPCCHDPLRLSLGSEDPFYIHNPRVRRARLRTPSPIRVTVGAPAARAACVRLPPRAGRRAPNALPKPFPPPRARSHAARVCPCFHAAPAQPNRIPPKLKRVSFRSTLAAPLTHPMRPRWRCVLHVRAAGPTLIPIRYPYP